VGSGRKIKRKERGKGVRGIKERPKKKNIHGKKDSLLIGGWGTFEKQKAPMGDD